MSTSMWKLERDLCRCCHAEGSFKNLSEPCYQLGQEEIYLDMLHESLDIKIIPLTGVLSDITYTICDSCIMRLRDASNFKRQVLDCEEKFKDMYSRNLIACEVKVEPTVSDSEEVKVEFQSMDDDDDDDEAFLKYHDDMVSTAVSTAEVPKTRGRPKSKAKAKTKPTPKKRVKKSTKEEESETTEPAASGEKKKGPIHTQFTLKREADGTNTVVCNDCHSRFKKRSHFSQHYKHVHLKQRPKLRSCYLCPEKVPSHQRAFHLESAHGWPAPTCGACGRKFAYPFQVLRHQRADHMGEKCHKCDYCDMTFASNYNLKQHTLKHSSEKQFQCDFCEKKFRWKNNLKTHVMIHLDERAHACPLCDAAFVQSSSLKYHLSKKHPDYDVPCNRESDSQNLSVW